MKFRTYRHAGLNFSIGESGDGAPVLFQHGLCGDALQTAEVFPEGDRWKCVTLECRGHGRSDAGDPRNFSIASFTDDLVSFIAAENLAPVVVGGISMGAAIALRLAVLHPNLVRGLILARPAWIAEAAPANMLPNLVAGELLRDRGPEEGRRAFDRLPLARTLAVEAPSNLASLQGFFSRTPHDVTGELLCRISADGPGVSRDDLHAIRVPTLVIGHARDVIHPLAMAQELAAEIPGAKFVQITAKADDAERFRHEFTAALSSFLEELA
ncbi:MAG TPA: alpha/beta hydrolase [Candidatus Acidoferrales bacterium]